MAGGIACKAEGDCRFWPVERAGVNCMITAAWGTRSPNGGITLVMQGLRI
jgi:hypothetical protein